MDKFTCIGRSHGAPAIPADKEQWIKVRRDPKLAELCRKIAECKNEETCRMLKSQLPVWTPRCAQFRNNHRAEKDAVRPLNRLMLDIDEKGLTDSIMQKLTYDSENHAWLCQRRVLIVEDSVRKGTHIMLEIREDDEPKRIQNEVSAALGVKVDPAVKNRAGCIYMVPDEYTRYVDESFFQGAALQAEVTTAHTEPAAPVVQPDSNQSQAGCAALQAVVAPSHDNSMYDGDIPYEMLVERMVEKLGGLPKGCGGRHAWLLTMACKMAPATDYSPAWLQSLMTPLWDRIQYNEPKPLDELTRICQTACERMFRPGRELRQAVVECRSKLMGNGVRGLDPMAVGLDQENAGIEADEDDGRGVLERELGKELKCPRLPKGLDTLVSIAPEPYRTQLAMAAMSPMMTLADRVTYTHTDGTPGKHLACHCLVIAPPASNKGVAIRQTEMLLSRRIEQDQQNLRKLSDNRKELRKAARSKKSAADVEEYEPQLLILPPSTSVPEFLKLQVRAPEHALFMYTPEISNMTSQSGWTDLRACYREGWDNDYHGQYRSTSDAYSGRTRIRINVLAAGTPDQAFGERDVSGRWVKGFYQSKSDGLASRLMIIRWGTNQRGERQPRFGQHTEAQKREIENMCLRLESEEGSVDVPRLCKAMSNWGESMRQLTCMADSALMDEFRKRSEVQGMCCGVVAYLLEGRKDNKTVSDWATYCASMCLQNLLEAYAHLEQPTQEQSGMQTRIFNLFSSLPQTFTIGQLVTLRRQNGMSPNVKNLLWRWREMGLIREAERGIYIKEPRTF